MLMLVAVLSSPTFFAQADGPSITYVHAGYKDSRYTGFKITIPTQDGGKVDITFAWEIASERGLRESSTSLRVYDTYPILQMVKLLKDDSLDYSLTYIPLYLIQFDDMNGDGILNVAVRKSLNKELFDEEVNWNLNKDKILKIYPLAPMLNRFERGEQLWSWTFNGPTVIRAEVPFEYKWSISASVKSFNWRFIDYKYKFERDTVNIRLDYHLTLERNGPKVKIGYSIDNMKWLSGEDVKLALISAVLYHGKNEVIIKEEGKYKDFLEIKDQRVALIEKVSESVKSLITHNPDAIIDGNYQMNVVISTLQPVFLISTPINVPEGVNVKGLNPSFSENINWHYRMVFAHQLTFPHFNEKIFQDPEIFLFAPLYIPSLINLTNFQWLIIIGMTIFIVYSLLKVILRKLLVSY